MQGLFHPTCYCYHPKEQRSHHPETSQVVTQISNTQQVLQEATQKRAFKDLRVQSHRSRAIFVCNMLPDYVPDNILGPLEVSGTGLLLVTSRRYDVKNHRLFFSFCQTVCRHTEVLKATGLAGMCRTCWRSRLSCTAPPSRASCRICLRRLSTR